MATLASNALTLSDWAKRRDPDGKTAKIVEMLSQSNEVLDDMVWQEGNLPTGHRTTLRTSLPTVGWRSLNTGTTPSKSTSAQVDEQCGNLDAWSEVDKDLADLSGDAAAFRLSEAAAFLEAMTQEMVGTLFYGNAGLAPEEFTGFAPRYAGLTGATGQNIITGSGSGSDNASIYLVGWGPNTVHGIFPKGSKAGLDHQNLGEVTVETTAGIAGARMRAYQDHFNWKAGLVVRDWRYVVRVPNIDISNLVAESSAADLIKLMIKATHRLPTMGGIRPAFYMNRTCFQMLDIQRFNVVEGSGLSYAEIDGKRIPSFRGIPVRTCDQLLETEATIS